MGYLIVNIDVLLWFGFRRV